MPRNWGRPIWCGLLSLLLPGLGQVRARAWTLGVVLFAIALFSNLAFRLFTQLAAPGPLTVAVFAVGGTLVLLILYLGAAIDAVLRFRRQPDARRTAWWQSTWLAALVFIAAGIGVDHTVPLGWENFSISSASTAPTLLPSDIVVVDRRHPRLALVRGATVVFRLPRTPAVPYIKRVVGLPGDTVQLRGGVLYLNRRPVPRDARGAYRLVDGSVPQVAQRYRETLPNGSAYDILKSTDLGEANNTPVYTVPAGRFFVLGDNRDNSADSRFFGFIPDANLIGRARVVIWARQWARIFSLVH